MTYGPNVFVNRQLVYNYPEQLFADKGVMVIEHADFEGIERLAVATGAEIVSTFDQADRADTIMGFATSIEEVMIGEDKFIKFNGCKSNKSCTIGTFREWLRHVGDSVAFYNYYFIIVKHKIIGYLYKLPI